MQSRYYYTIKSKVVYGTLNISLKIDVPIKDH